MDAWGQHHSLLLLGARVNPGCLCKAYGWKERVWAKRFLLAFRALHIKSPISFSLTPLPPVAHTTGSLKHLLLKTPQTTLNLQCSHLKLQMKRQGPDRELHFFEITQEASLDLFAVQGLGCQLPLFVIYCYLRSEGPQLSS